MSGNLRNFYCDKKIFIFGHSSFRGTWLSLFLQYLGAEVCGFSSFKPTNPSVFIETDMNNLIESYINDEKYQYNLKKILEEFMPDIIIYITPSRSFDNQREISNTYSANITNILKILEYCKKSDNNQPFFINIIPGITPLVFSGDLINRKISEFELLKGSFLSAEILTTGFRNASENGECYVNLSAPEVIGGGDWSKLSIMNLLMQSVNKKTPLIGLMEHQTHRFVHVLDFIWGVLTVIRWKSKGNDEKLEDVEIFTDNSNELNEFEIACLFRDIWGDLELDIEKSSFDRSVDPLKLYLGNYSNADYVCPVLGSTEAIQLCVEWEKARNRGADMKRFSLKQIEAYLVLLKQL